MKCLLVPLLALVFSFAACTKEKNFSGELSPIEGAHSRPGLGDNPGLPTGTDWVLPAKISVVARPHHAFDSDLSKLYGSANTFYTDISFVNDSTIPIMVRIPSGLMFVQGLSLGRLCN